MPVRSLSEPIKERIPRLLEAITLGEDVQWEASIQLQPGPQGMSPMVAVILIIASGVLGQEIIGAALMPLGMAQNDDMMSEHLRAMWSNLLGQRSHLLANPLDLPTNGIDPQGMG